MANRHDVIIWDAEVYGAPDGFTEYTYEKAYALIKQPAKPSKKLLAFARDVEKYSQSNDVPPVVAQYFVGFEDDIKAESMAAYRFNLPEYNWQNIVKILLKEAIKHGLALFDEQIILVLLPNGTILPENSRKSWLQILNAPKQKNAFPETLVELSQLFKADIGELLARHDFVLEIESSEYDEIGFAYIRQTSSVSHKLGFGCEGGDGQFKVGYSIQLAEKNMIEIGHKSDFRYYGDGGVLLNIPNLIMNKSRFSIDSWESYEQFKTILKRSALTWSDTALDIKGLDALLNGNIDNRVKQSVHRLTYMPYALIVARLADNPHFEELAINLGRWGVSSNTSWPAGIKSPIEIAWPKLVQYLREEADSITSLIDTKPITPQKTKELPTAIKEVLKEYLQERTALDWPRQYTFTFWLIQDDDELLCFLTELMNCMWFEIFSKAEEAWQVANNPDNLEEDENTVALREKAEFAKFPPIYATVYRIIEGIYSSSIYQTYVYLYGWQNECTEQLIEGLRLLSLNKLADAYITVINSLPPYDPDEDLDQKICEQRFRSAFESVIEYDREQQLADICEAIRKNYHLFLV